MKLRGVLSCFRFSRSWMMAFLVLVLTPASASAQIFEIAPEFGIGFGPRPINQTVSQNVLITNTDPSNPMTIGIIIQVGEAVLNYAHSNDACSNQTLAAGGGNCQFTVLFTPTVDGGIYQTEFQIPNDSATPLVNYSVSGLGEAGDLISSGALTFTNVPVGATSTAQTVTLTNTNTIAPVHLGSLQQVGASPQNFMILNDDCSQQTLDADGGGVNTCTFDVVFLPDATGAVTDSILVPNDSTVPNLTVGLTGTGVVGALTSSGALTFTNVTVGTTSTAQTVTLTNTSTTAPVQITSLQHVGASPQNFTILNDNCSNQTIAAGGANTCTFQVRFTPTATGAVTDSILVPNNSGTPALTVALSGTGVVGSLSSSGALSFTNVTVGTTSSAQTVTITNTSVTSAVQLSSLQHVGASPQNFTILNDNCSNQTIAAGGANTCTFQVRFTPSATGAVTDSILVPNNSSSSALTVGLTGTGVVGSLSSSGALSFTNIPVGTTSSAQTVTITNTSVTSAVQLGSLQHVGASPQNFTILNDNCSDQMIAAGGSNTCTFQVTFSPSATTAVTDSILVPNTSGAPSVTVGLSGTGIVSDISVAPAAPFNFGNVAVGTESSAQTFTVTNAGAAPLLLGQLALVGTNAFNFAITSDACSNATVAASGTCQFSVVFFPTAGAAFTANVSIPSNDPSSPFSYAVSGTGILPSLAANPLSLSFANQNINTSSAGQVITLTNSSAAPVVILGATTTGANAGDFNVAVDDCSTQSLVSGGTCQIQGAFSPRSTGAKSASIVVWSDDPQNPYILIAVDGTGIDDGGGGGGSSSPVGLSPSVLSFSNTDAFSTANQSMTLTNVGTGTLLITDVSIGGVFPGPFSTTGDCAGASLAAGGTCTQEVVFAPITEGNFNATLNFSTNASATPASVVLLGSSIPANGNPNGGGGCSSSLNPAALSFSGNAWFGYGSLSLGLMLLGRLMKRRG